MLNSFFERLAVEFTRQDYVVETESCIPGLSARLYVWSPRRIQLGFAKVEDHFVFVEWGDTPFDRTERLEEFYQQLSVFANRRFNVPHGLRLQIPNLAIVAVTEGELSPEAARYARSAIRNPWYGGETGQILMVSLAQRQVLSPNLRSTSRYPTPGALPLGHAAQIIREACEQTFTGQKT